MSQPERKPLDFVDGILQTLRPEDQLNVRIVIDAIIGAERSGDDTSPQAIEDGIKQIPEVQESIARYQKAYQAYKDSMRGLS
jgi:hypothetical protein